MSSNLLFKLFTWIKPFGFVFFVPAIAFITRIKKINIVRAFAKKRP